MFNTFTTNDNVKQNKYVLKRDKNNITRKEKGTINSSRKDNP